MRILSAIIRNYRVHRQLSVQFDSARTLIGGANECGKSTLVEAIHRALFLRSRFTGEAQKRMISTQSGAQPEVELEFACNGKHYRLCKIFSGARGSTRLTESGGSTWSGDEAEAALAELLKVEAPDGGRGASSRLCELWAHLWIWQGFSGQNPSDAANLEKQALLAQLQQKGGAAAMQSALDSKVASRFSELAASLFTQAGRPKAGSELEKAESALREAEAELGSASARVQRLDDAIIDYAEAIRVINGQTTNLVKLRSELAQVEMRQQRAAELLRTQAAQGLEFKGAVEQAGKLERDDQVIRAKRAEATELTKALVPQEAVLVRLANARDMAREAAENAASALDATDLLTRESRMKRELAAALVARFERSEALNELHARLTKVSKLQGELAEARRELSSLPAIDHPALKKLLKLQNEALLAEAALAAIATEIKVVTSDGIPVKLQSSHLSPGETRTVTEDAELEVGPTVRIRIRPGGGSGLTHARDTADSARKALRKSLDHWGIETVDQATEVHTRRNELAERLRRFGSALEALDADRLPQQLQAMEEAVNAAATEVQRRHAQFAGLELPSTLVDSRGWHASFSEAVERGERQEKQLRAEKDLAARNLEAAGKAWEIQHAELAGHRQRLGNLETEFNLLEEISGSDDDRRKAIFQACQVRESLEARLAITRKQLAELQPELLSEDAVRLQRALQHTELSLKQAGERKAAAGATLKLDGVADPQAELALAQARTERARENARVARRKAESIRLLDQLFAAEQRALADRFTQPLAGKISDYLQCLFGAGARAVVSLTDEGFSGLQLVRPDCGLGAVPFESLSGGAQEQVAAAVRLAMAEILAQGHDGCLPIVFDDAFAYSDPERVQTLQRMLNLAAKRGLQIVVLTCTPSDYVSLGAKEVLIGNALPTSNSREMSFRPATLDAEDRLEQEGERMSI
jgi:energy-coupling factor transporter ATP-binding protein EcfA2